MVTVKVGSNDRFFFHIVTCIQVKQVVSVSVVSELAVLWMELDLNANLQSTVRKGCFYVIDNLTYARMNQSQ